MSHITIKGVAKAVLKYDDGTIKEVENCNMVVNSGLDFIIKSLIYSGQNRPSPLGYVAIGTGGGATSATMTGLVSETNRAAGTWSYDEGSKKFVITAEYPKGSVTGLITEGGVFNADSSGVMFDRVLFTSPIQGTSDMTYTQIFTFTVG